MAQTHDDIPEIPEGIELPDSTGADTPDVEDPDTEDYSDVDLSDIDTTEGAL